MKVLRCLFAFAGGVRLLSSVAVAVAVSVAASRRLGLEKLVFQRWLPYFLF